MTDTIDQLAREVLSERFVAAPEYQVKLVAVGMRAMRDRCAAIAKDYRENAGGSESYRRACDHIETTIRSQGE